MQNRLIAAIVEAPLLGTLTIAETRQLADLRERSTNLDGQSPSVANSPMLWRRATVRVRD